MKNDLRNSDEGTLAADTSARYRKGDIKLDFSYPIEVRVGQGVHELMALESHWRALVEKLPRRRYIDAFDWQLAYLKYLEPNSAATHYVSFFADGNAIAIFPLHRVRRSVGRISLWLWELPNHPHCVLGEPLISPEWNTAFLINQLIKTLNLCRDMPWDALHLPNLLDDTITVRHLQKNASTRTRLEKTGASMYFRCNDMTTALANCSGAFKRNLRRQGKKLSKHGVVTVALARQGEELDAAFADFLRLEASGWKGEEGKASAIRLHPHLLGFYAEIKDRFAANDACLIALLKLNDVAIAAQFCLLTENTLYIQKIAYDEAWSVEAPGSQLLYKVLEYCCSDPNIHHLSLVTAPAWAVGRWNLESDDVWEVYVFNPGLRGLGALAMRRFKALIWNPSRILWRRTRSALKCSSIILESIIK